MLDCVCVYICDAGVGDILLQLVADRADGNLVSITLTLNPFWCLLEQLIGESQIIAVSC